MVKRQVLSTEVVGGAGPPSTMRKTSRPRISATMRCQRSCETAGTDYRGGRELRSDPGGLRAGTIRKATVSCVIVKTLRFQYSLDDRKLPAGQLVPWVGPNRLTKCFGRAISP